MKILILSVAILMVGPQKYVSAEAEFEVSDEN